MARLTEPTQQCGAFRSRMAGCGTNTKPGLASLVPEMRVLQKHRDRTCFFWMTTSWQRPVGWITICGFWSETQRVELVRWVVPILRLIPLRLRCGSDQRMACLISGERKVPFHKGRAWPEATAPITANGHWSLVVSAKVFYAATTAKLIGACKRPAGRFGGYRRRRFTTSSARKDSE